MPVVLSSCPSQLDTQVEPGISIGAAPTECLHRRVHSRCTQILCPSSSYLPRYALSHFSRSSTVVLLVHCEALSTCSSLFFCNAHRPSSAAIISSYIKDVALPGLQRNMEREMIMNVRSKRWKRESGVKLNTKLVGLGRSWLVLNMELVELQVLQLASSFSHYQYILCPYESHIFQTARFPPRNAFSYHDVD